MSWVTRDGLETARNDLGGAYEMIRDSVPRPPNRRKCNVFLSQLYTPLCGCKCLSSLLREHKLSWVTQRVFRPSAKPYQSPAVASWSFDLAAFYKAAAIQEETWPAMKEAAVTEQPTQWYFAFEWEGGENVTAAVVSPAAVLCSFFPFFCLFRAKH